MAAELTLPETVTLSRASPEGELQTSADSGPLETIELVQLALPSAAASAGSPGPSPQPLLSSAEGSSELTKPAKAREAS